MTDNYTRLYEAWRKEKQRIDIQPLQENFHASIAEYVTQLREQTKTVDKSTLAGKIVDKEKEHVERMISRTQPVKNA